MAEKSYSRFNITEREILFKRLAERKQQNEIAIELGRHPSSISREIRRNRMDRQVYSPTKAEQHARTEAEKRRRRYKLITNQPLVTFVEEKLKQRWSPEQISGAVNQLFPDNTRMRISHETIYRYIYAVDDKNHRTELIDCLRQGRKYRRPKNRKHNKGSRIRNIVPISERPIEAKSRQQPGHWEGDLIIGKDHQSAIGTLVERTTRLVFIVSFNRIPNAIDVALGFAAALGTLPAHMKRSLTYDRGTEMASHQKFTEITGIPVFFADPYSPWQRGSNENTNGLIRDYFPKKTDFRDVEDEELFESQLALNCRPRKLLQFHTPMELFQWFLDHPGVSFDDFILSTQATAI